MENKTHRLKIHESLWDSVFFEHKKAEFRKNDRDFKTGDILELIPVNDAGDLVDDVTGSVPLELQVSHTVYGPSYGIPDGFCMMSVELI